MLASYALVCALLPNMTQDAAAVLKAGDKVKVVVANAEEFEGEYLVADDGSISGVGFGRIVVSGKTVTQARDLVRLGLLKILRDPQVSLVLVEQKKEFVFVTSLLVGATGPIDFEKGMDVRKAITGVSIPEETDLYWVRLFRKGKQIGQERLNAVLSGGEGLGAEVLLPNDVVTIAEVVQHRVYVAGKVRTPGEIRVKEGTDALQAVALAGGTTEQDLEEIEYTVKVRRGEQVFSVDRSADAERFLLLPGDTVVVDIPTQMRVYVGGQVNLPAEVQLRSGAPVMAAVQKAGGLAEDGSLTQVMVFRGTDTFSLDLSGAAKGEAGPSFELLDGDVVFVRPNDRRILVLGFAMKPGRLMMEDGKEYRLADAVSWAGGTAQDGSYRRVYVGRPGEGGKLVVTTYRLDEFLKDGNMEQNPLLEAGDVVMVGQPKGLSTQSLTQILTNALFLDSLIGR